MTPTPDEAISLLDWKRQIFALYARIRNAGDHEAAWNDWVKTREDLYRSHPQSPVSQDARSRFTAGYFSYDARYRVAGALRTAEPQTFEIATSGPEPMRFTRFGTCEFHLLDKDFTLELYWLDAYAGGLFVPFKDDTSGATTYGAGRYLLDTVKGSDLGTEDGKLILDFNFAFNPSCAYDPRWVCPLTPPPNRLDIAIEAGEKTPAS